MAKCVITAPGSGGFPGSIATNSIDAAFGGPTPPVPLTTVLVPNGTGQIQTVTISGGTMSNVSVNGLTAGAGAGTYTVPLSVRPQDGISMVFSAAPTWVWSPPVLTTPAA